MSSGDHTEIVTVGGVVQGVGFRPAVYRIAERMGMKGRVRNMGSAVRIIVTDSPARIDAFFEAVVSGKPPMSRIDRLDRKVIGTVLFSDFLIEASSRAEDEIAVIPADIAICDDCAREFLDPGNPRFLHPFISCTNCGPRYTIMERLPYDRDTTAMDPFAMCAFCEGEYTNPAARRYHAQTISCHACGPQPIFATPGGRQDDAVHGAIDAVRGGGVIALKGVGGYCLACSPFDPQAVETVRRIKMREQKPFAVMFSDANDARKHCLLSPIEADALASPQRPIVLLERRPVAAFAPGVCGASRFVGALLPSFGLQMLLARALGPLVMTSANRSDAPIITSDDEMLSLAKREPGIAGVLYNERLIAAGIDDSILRVVDGTPQIIRRARGYVPSPVYVKNAEALTKHHCVFSAGGHLKSVFALSKGGFSYLSRHLGDMGSLESERLYEDTFRRMKTFFGIEPGLAVCDLHPHYFPTKFAEECAKGAGHDLLYAQHHHAHIASVMAEHGLDGPVIGVSFDGTGYGTDGTVWGGEILLCEGAGFERFSHLRTVDMIGGDAQAKDAWKSAAAHLAAPGAAGAADGFEIDLTAIAAYCKTHHALTAMEAGRADARPPETARLPSPFPAAALPTDADLGAAAAAIRVGVNTVKTSSMGRLFDAACAMLGIHHTNRYEGECAILLENAAQRAMDKRRAGRQPAEQERLALAFHLDVAQAILKECAHARAARGIHEVCLSGGVFQNRILMEEALRLLRAGNFTVYYNINVPPNDGGIALGQNFIGMQTLLRQGK
ncbi:MAG: carbamoyltransferase HypF [Clostridiales Family XIII bacterium]|jgi:hydrogenase maturation protein HypF|nr:carbamoyltransferase HypF [Clostridiales Family XIII bacterium]